MLLAGDIIGDRIDPSGRQRHSADSSPATVSRGRTHRGRATDARSPFHHRGMAGV